MNIEVYHFEPGEITPYDEIVYKDVKRFHFDSDKNTLYLVFSDGRTEVIEHRHRISIYINEG